MTTTTSTGMQQIVELDALRQVVILRGMTEAPSYREDLKAYERECRAAGIDPDSWEGIQN